MGPQPPFWQESQLPEGGRPKCGPRAACCGNNSVAGDFYRVGRLKGIFKHKSSIWRLNCGPELAYPGKHDVADHRVGWATLMH